MLEAAAQVLVAEGYGGLTTAAVAERAGVSAGTLYQYYADKAALVAGVVEAHLASEAAAVGVALADGAALAPAEAVDRVVRAFVGVNVGDPARTAAYLVAAREVAWTEGVAAVAAQSVEAVTALVGGWPDPARPSDPAAAAFVAVSAVDGLVQRAVVLRPAWAASGALADEACALARRYLLPGGGDSGDGGS